MQRGPWGAGAGVVVGSLLTLAALTMNASWGRGAAPAVLADDVGGLFTQAGIWNWLVLNLGHSFWFFALVLVLYLMNVRELRRALLQAPDSRQVVELDQLSDVWIHLFVGIGVIWTAVGMRSALQTALGDPSGALTDTADNVLRKLVDGGILLALTTTIVGGIGGYLMRLFKTVVVGAQLQLLFDNAQRADLRELIVATERIESKLVAGAALPPVTRAHAH